MNDLEKMRREIDAIDRQLAALFNRRMATVRHIAQYKSVHAAVIYDQKREAAIIQQAQKQCDDAEMRPYQKVFFEQLLALSRRYQQALIDSRNDQT